MSGAGLAPAAVIPRNDSTVDATTTYSGATIAVAVCAGYLPSRPTTTPIHPPSTIPSSCLHSVSTQLPVPPRISLLFTSSLSLDVPNPRLFLRHNHLLEIQAIVTGRLLRLPQFSNLVAPRRRVCMPTRFPSSTLNGLGPRLLSL